jgi:hypothetical protein
MAPFDPPRTVGEEVHVMLSMSRTLGCIQWRQLGHIETWRQWVTCVDKAIEFVDTENLEAAIECLNSAHDLERAHSDFTPLAKRVIKSMVPILATYKLNPQSLREVHTR